MKTNRVLQTAGVVALAALALAGCASNESSSSQSASSEAVSGTIKGAGSSAQTAAQTAWIKDFQTANSGANVTYNPVGSGAGRSQFEQGSVNFAGSDAALSDDELNGTFQACKSGSKAIDLPVYISPIAVVYNLDGVKDLKLDAATIAGIFSGKITTWNAPEIKALNPNATLPSTTITPVHRSDNSGTTANFTDYLHQAAASTWTEASSGDWPASFGGSGAQGTSGVISTVKSGSGTIGYADESQVGDLSVAQIKVGSDFVKPTAKGAAALAETAKSVEGRDDNDLALSLNRTTTDSSEYPITLVSYLITCQTYNDSSVAKVVSAYAKYVASDAGQEAASKAAGSAPLSKSLAAKVTKVAESIK
ncbi:MAG: phosphate ABC transporter substrate-binding protein PstS [Microbacteriaceae bacterium]|nr:phosphate ABC transporter substrate-binding protein PstS [Microbacteriaceae bacterium]